MRFKNDLTGKRFGKLVVLGTEEGPTNKSYWKVQCDCGTIRTVRGNNLTCKNPRSQTRSCGCGRAKPPGEAARNHLIAVYKRNAKKREREWALSDDQAERLFQGNCYFCGKPPAQIAQPTRKDRTHSGDFIYNGIDRYNNDKGYTIENCVSCCKRCNIAKGDMSIPDFINWIRDIYILTIEQNVFEHRYGRGTWKDQRKEK